MTPGHKLYDRVRRAFTAVLKDPLEFLFALDVAEPRTRRGGRERMCEGRPDLAVAVVPRGARGAAASALAALQGWGAVATAPVQREVSETCRASCTGTVMLIVSVDAHAWRRPADAGRDRGAAAAGVAVEHPGRRRPRVSGGRRGAPRVAGRPGLPRTQVRRGTAQPTSDKRRTKLTASFGSRVSDHDGRPPADGSLGSYVSSYAFPSTDDGAALQHGARLSPRPRRMLLSGRHRSPRPRSFAPSVLLTVHAQSATGLLPPTVVQQALQAAGCVTVAARRSDGRCPNVAHVNLARDVDPFAATRCARGRGGGPL